MAKKIRVWDGSAWQDVAPALPYTAVHSAQASMPSTAVDGQIWLDTDASVPSTSVTRWYKLPSAGTTTLSGNDDNSIPLAYTPGYEQVFLNGTLLSRSAADYTATTGTSVVLSSAIVAGDIVEIICPLQITTTDTYTQSATNAAFQANTNNFAAGKNKVLNGDFRINQRNFTSTTSDGYTFDRFNAIRTGNGTSTYTSQTFQLGSAPLSGYESKNYLQVAVSGESSSTSYTIIQNRIEDVRTLAGQTATISFWAKASSGTPKILTYLQQQFGTGGSPSAATTTAGTLTTITTSWQRYSFTVTLPSISGKVMGTNPDDYLTLTILVSAGSATGSPFDGVGIQNNTFQFWGIQLEAGSNATAFQTATGTIQGELAACQRYYVRFTAGTNYTFLNQGGFYNSTTNYLALHTLPVAMRVPPTAVDYSALRTVNSDNNAYAVSAITFSEWGTLSGYNNVTTATATSLKWAALSANNSSSAYIGFSAEL